jgi:hypothetical protein
MRKNTARKPDKPGSIGDFCPPNAGHARTDQGALE